MSLLRRSLPVVSRIPLFVRTLPVIPVRTFRSERDSVLDSVKKTAANLAESAQSTLHTAKEKITKGANRASESMSSAYNDMNSKDQSMFEKGGNKISEMGSKMKHRAQEATMEVEDASSETAFKAKNFQKSEAGDSWHASGMSRDSDHDFAATNSDADFPHSMSEGKSVTERVGDTASSMASSAASGLASMAHEVKEKLTNNSEDDGDWSERAAKTAENIEHAATQKKNQWKQSDDDMYHH